MKKTLISIIHWLSVMSVEQIEHAQEEIRMEQSFNEVHRSGFLALCDLAIEEKRRCQRGKR